VRRVSTLGFGRRSTLGRLVGDASFHAFLGAEVLLRLPRPDVVVSLTTPPFVGMLARVVARLRGAAHVHWVMDVYPDVMAAHGMLDRRGLMFRALGYLSRAQLRGAGLVLGLGPYMEHRLRADAPPNVPVEWVPLWGEDPPGPAPAEAIRRVRAERAWSPDDLVLFYSGNMGLGHRFGEFLEAARRLGPKGPLWAFAGGGARRREVEEFARGHSAARIQLLPYVTRGQVRESLSASDVQLVSLSAAWQGLIVPSKLPAIFSVARPVIFVGSRDNEIAEWIRESGAGWIVAEDDIDGLLSAVAAAGEREERERRGRAALAFACQRFDRSRNAQRIVSHLERVAGVGA
jgi:glycosyltransferase involved in cell wall biosynthesis